MPDTCFGCKWLRPKMLASGGGLYLCDRWPGVVRGEWGLWADESDVPRPLEEGCYTQLKTALQRAGKEGVSSGGEAAHHR